MDNDESKSKTFSLDQTNSSFVTNLEIEINSKEVSDVNNNEVNIRYIITNLIPNICNSFLYLFIISYFLDMKLNDMSRSLKQINFT